MTISPAFAEFESKYKEGIAQVLIDRFVSDLDTPVSAYLKLAARQRNSFLLESVEGGESLGRYSIIGVKPDAIWRADGMRAYLSEDAAGNFEKFSEEELAPLESLKKFVESSRINMPEGAPPMAAGIFGYFGYDMVRQIERIPDNPTDDLGVADAIFLRPTLIAVFDNIAQQIILVAPIRPQKGVSARDAYSQAKKQIAIAVDDLKTPLDAPAAPVAAAEDGVNVASNMTPDAYKQVVSRAKEYIAAGDIFQVVLSQRFSSPFTASPFELYRALRRTNPSPFLFFLDFGEHALVGSSPEILVRVRDGEVTIRPIAGTRPRGKSIAEDNALAEELLADKKERAEHLMLLDLGRNDVGRSAEIGAVTVTDAFSIERYSHVMHIVSNVVGALRKNIHPVDAVAAGFPAGTVSGAPKIRAMEIIDELETTKRGPYGGAIGYFSADGNVDTCIALRTACVKEGIMHVQAGAGIVADSNPENEQQECEAKAQALFAAARAALSLTEA